MVNVDDWFCIDRYEAMLVDSIKSRRASPYYPPTQVETTKIFETWQEKATEEGTEIALKMPIPKPPEWQLNEFFRVVAVSRAGVTPNGYLTGHVAKWACKHAGKRLCTHDEWKFACRGEKDSVFPYGDIYKKGACNIVRQSHPAWILHRDPGANHSDPRMLLLAPGGKPLLKKTGQSKVCASKWWNDAIYDMVGNLDEWVEDKRGRFAGGFFSRQTKKGCEVYIKGHPMTYYDYSIGARCCKGPKKE